MTEPGRTPAFAGAVTACGVLGAAAGFLADSAPRAPDYALDSMLVYRFEIGLVVFVGLYLALVLIRLAYHGRTPTRIGASGADFPDIGLLSNALSNLRDASGLMEAVPGEVADQIGDLEQRIATLEQREAVGGDHG